MKRPEYLLAVMPGTYISNLVSERKYLLSKVIGPFGSDKSLAHITVLGFDANLEQLQYYTNKISEFCNNCASQEISFEGYNSFGINTFYVKPDKNSRIYLNNLIRSLQRFIDHEPKNVNAHMTIARELDENRMKQAFSFFKNDKTNFNFLCNGFVLRKFNRIDGQYSDLIAEFKFSEQQTKLF